MTTAETGPEQQGGNASAEPSTAADNETVNDAREQTKTGRARRMLPEIGLPQVKDGLDPARARGDHRS